VARLGAVAARTASTGLPRSSRLSVLGACTSTLVVSFRRATTTGTTGSPFGLFRISLPRNNQTLDSANKPFHQERPKAESHIIDDMKFKICTSIEQSKKLLSLGLDPSSADMIYTMVNGQNTPFIRIVGETIEEDLGDIPAWSIAGLLELIPLYTLEQTTDGKVISVSEIGQYSKCSEAFDSPIDAAFEMVCWLIEQKHIKVNK